MKRIILFSFIALLLSSCGIYTHTSGIESKSALSFVDDKAYQIEVTIDGKTTTMTTVPERAWRKNRKIKRTAKNSVDLETGRHSLCVKLNGVVLIEKELFLSAGEHKIIEL